MVVQEELSLWPVACPDLTFRLLIIGWPSTLRGFILLRPIGMFELFLVVLRFIDIPIQFCLIVIGLQVLLDRLPTLASGAFAFNCLTVVACSPLLYARTTPSFNGVGRFTWTRTV